ncbi:F165 [Hirschfeldia incana]|nr:F165 [Hirschfeldia incana]
MGTKVHSETLSPTGRYHHSMRDLNNDFNACTRLPLLNNSDNNNTLANDQSSSYRDVVRRTMLEHEAVFKSQVLELHRVYGIQKDMMDELKRKQFNREWCPPIEASCSSQPNDDVRKWNTPSFPLPNSVYDRPSMSVVEDNGHSPMKGGQVPWQNGASSKHVETLEVRPTKMRRKMIDLCIPADEYVDDNEDVVELKDHRVSQLPNGGGPRGDGLRSGYGSSNRTNGLADLNEPFKETNEVAYGRVPVSSVHPDENGKPKAWPQQHQPLRIDHYSGTHKSTTPFLQPGKPLDSFSQPMQMNSSQRVMGLPYNAGPPPPQSKADFWRGKTFIDLEADDTDTTNTSHESSFASHQQPRHLYPYNPTSEPAVPWNRLHSSWQNPSFGFPQRVAASAQRYPVLNLSDTNAQKLGGLGDRLQFESNARYNNSGFGNNHNMFYNECSSSTNPKGSGYSYPNGGRSDHSLLDLNGSEVKSLRDLNLNVTLSNGNDDEHVATLPWLVKTKSVSNDAVPSSSLKPSNIKKEEGGNGVQNLMWLERLKSGSSSSKPPETEKIKAGTAYRDESNTERDKVRLMVDINEPCEQFSDEDQQTEKQTGTKVSVGSKCLIDLNMSVSEDEEEESLSVPTSSRLNSKRPMIDLETVPESDVEEEQSEETPTEEETLEKPPEFEKLAAEAIVAISSACLDRELEPADAASSPETVILHWFAETVDTHRENLDQKLASPSRNQARSIEEIDYFESMTLTLPEITEEEYMPEPLVPEDLVLEETSAAATSHQRPRRGNARKGKQRRDFQRDILPGLLSLSKHEVTEDIQLFDGFMRAATGSSWTPTCLTRKKTGARGRPRRVITTNPEPVVYYPVQAPCPSSVQQNVGNQSNNGEVEMGFEDGSFGGWGKMTRRPRRQRCPSTVTTSVTNVHHHTRMSRDGWE